MSPGEWLTIIGMALGLIGAAFGAYLKLAGDIAVSRHHMRNEMTHHVGKVDLECQGRLDKMQEKLDAIAMQNIATLGQVSSALGQIVSRRGTGD